MATESLHDLYVHQLQDLYSAETQILDALPKMIDKTSHSELERGFKAHLKQTEEHVSRLEEIFEDLGEEAGGVTCKGMQGLLKEGDEAIKEWSDSDVLDAALIAAAQRVEHYEIAGYGCARTYAQALGREADATLLDLTIHEEGDTDKQLTQIAESVVNPAAQFGDRDVTRAAATESRTRRRDGGSETSPGASAR